MTSQALYQQVILDHNRKPRNFRKIEATPTQAEGYNPLCGDHLWVYLKVNDAGIIEDCSFEGEGCAISKASASMMTGFLKGKTREDAKALFEAFHALLTGEPSPESQDKLSKLHIFSGVRQYPARIKCAVLAWHTMMGALAAASQPVSTEGAHDPMGGEP